MTDLLTIGHAVLSDDLRYRYRLDRDFVSRRGCDRKKTAVFILLNPSSADADIDDPTVRRCIGFCARWRCGRLVIVNLFAWRATKVRDLKRAKDPVGPGNDAAIRKAVREATKSKGVVVAAWGANGSWLGRAREVMDMLGKMKADAVCLCRTGGGAPEHPLYVAYDVTPESFEVAGSMAPR